MKRLLNRRGGRSPRATLRIEANREPPPGDGAGGGVMVTVTLCPQEPFLALRGWLELQLATTRFSRTTLDGYREHTTEERWQTVELCENVQASPGQSYVYSAALRIPESAPAHSRPVRMSWQVKASIEPQGRRGFSATAGLSSLAPPQGGAPVVDGRGFLPLYEFGAKPGIRGETGNPGRTPAPEPPLIR